MKRRSILILAGVCMAVLVLSPSLALAADQVFTNQAPAFTVTYPGGWAQDPANPNNVVYRAKDASGIPIMEIQVREITAGVDLAVAGSKGYKPLVEASQETSATITSEKQIKLADGTPANECTMDWLYQGWLPLMSHIVSAYKDGKWVYVVIHQDPGPNSKVPPTLTFK